MKHIVNAILIGFFIITSHVYADGMKKEYIEINGQESKGSVPSSEDLMVLAKTYGYIKGQQFSLDKIKREYPELEIEVIKAELEFKLTFKKAIGRISSELKRVLGVNFDKYEAKMMNQLKSMISNQDITKDVAINFIKDVNRRAKGNIESPILETLLTFQFIDSPSKEFTREFVQTYSTKDHQKAKSINLKAKFPLSWKQKEGDRPNVIQKFVSENGKGLEMMLFMVADLELDDNSTFSKEELYDFFSENELKEMLPANSQFISGKRITLDGQVGGQIIFKTIQQRLDYSISMQSIHYITIYKGKMIFLQCMVSTIKEKDLGGQFDLFLPLFRQVANSLIIMNKY